jgi:hypothetical protein
MGSTHFQMKTLKNVSTEMAARSGLQHETGDVHSGRCRTDGSAALSIGGNLPVKSFPLNLRSICAI